MLKAAHEAKEHGIDVVAGYIEPHARPDTQALTEGLEMLSPPTLEYKGVRLREFDLDAALQRKPQLSWLMNWHIPMRRGAGTKNGIRM